MKNRIYPLSHFNERPDAIIVDTIVIHSMYAKGHKRKTSAIKCFEILDQNRVSSHYSIDRYGQVWRHVCESLRAWHAGDSSLKKKNETYKNVNDFSIGIEVIGVFGERFKACQYKALVSLIKDITSRTEISFITSHSHISPHRKVDPGPSFNWTKLERMLKRNKNWLAQIII